MMHNILAFWRHDVHTSLLFFRGYTVFLDAYSLCFSLRMHSYSIASMLFFIRGYMQVIKISEVEELFSHTSRRPKMGHTIQINLATYIYRSVILVSGPAIVLSYAPSPDLIHLLTFLHLLHKTRHISDHSMQPPLNYSDRPCWHCDMQEEFWSTVP